jgi:demethylmenaquinone methyltransferase/2-methoxy-6-polyprenyl-1,4-benzoquinol methylase
MTKVATMPDGWLQEKQDFYDRISSVYDAMSDHYERASRERGLRLLNPRSGERFLEIGSGTGHVLEEVARSDVAVRSIFGVEASAGMNAQAAGLLSGAGVADRVRLLQADARFLPFRDTALDAIFLSYTLELFGDEWTGVVLKECRRVLKPGGRLCTVSMSEAQGHSLSVSIFEWLHEKFPHWVDCRPIRARDELEHAGFDIRAHEFSEVWKLPVEIAVGVKP